MLRTLAQTEDGGLVWDAPSGKAYPTGDVDVPTAPRKGLRVVEGAEAAAVLYTNAMREQPKDNPMIPTRGIPYGLLLHNGVGPSQLRNALLRQARRVSAKIITKNLEVSLVGRHFAVNVSIGFAGTDDLVTAKVTLGG